MLFSQDFLVAQMVKNLSAVQKTQVPSLDWEDPLETEMAIHSSILAWRIPGTEEPGGLQPMGLQRVGHDWATNTTITTCYYPIEERCELRFIFFLQYSTKCIRPCRNSCFWHVANISSVQFSHSVMSNSLKPHEPQPPSPSPTPGVHQNSSLSWWCHSTISSSVVPFSSCPQSFPASRSLKMSQLFTSGGQSIGVSASTSVLPVNTQNWSPLGWTVWISLQSKRLSRVFSNTTVQKHQCLGAELSSQSNSHIHTWPLEKT